MRKILLVVIIAALTLCAHWLRDTYLPVPSASPVPSPSASARDTLDSRANATAPGSRAGIPARAPAPAFRQAPAPAVPPSQPAWHPYTLAPKDSVIEFTIVDGQAVAYGDVLIGTPEPGFDKKRGHYEALKPQLWARPEIPYLINPELPEPKRVETALEYLRQHTPVRFIPFDGHRDAVVFEAGNENCLSPLGRVGGLQPIKLSAACQWQEILHEIMHTLGFVHEQSRPDRDRHVEVVWPNIAERFQPQFAIVPEVFLEAIGDEPFDYHSVMLYPPEAFAVRPGEATLRSKGTDPIAPTREGLSPGDIRRVNRLFGIRD